MSENELLKTIRSRRSVIRFEKTEVSEDQVEAILEAGRWAPSFINSQPWEFIVVRAPEMRTRIAEILRRVTISWKSFGDAPVLIIIAVNTLSDPHHYIEDGAAAAQNMALMTHSLGLASFWAGIRSRKRSRGTPEGALQALLGIPRGMRLIAVLPIGVSAYQPESTRKPLSQMIHHGGYSNGGQPRHP